MENLNRARSLAGSAFDDMADAEVSSTLTYSEKGMGREFKASEASYFKDALCARRTYLAKQAGLAQPKFEAAMYGQSRMTNTPDQPEGFQGE